MINVEKIIKNISNQKISVIGAGISGQGASNLATYLGAKVLLSTNKRERNIKLISDTIDIEFSHSEKCLASDLAIISPGINPDKSSIIRKMKKSNLPIISEIEFGFWFSKAPIIAITGSNGKSTVVNMLNDIFKKKYDTVLLGGNIGKSFCMNVIKELQSNTKSIIHILELSSFQLEQIIKFKPTLSCILNIQEDHIDRHKNFSNYFNAKMNIVKNLNDKSYIVYNQDDINLNENFKNKKNAIPFSIKNKNRLFTQAQKVYSSNTNIQIIDQNETKLIGIHNLSNILASIQIAKIFNINNNKIKEALINFKPLNHRMEKIITKNNILFINDSKGTNLYSTKYAIESFSNEIILILGGYSNEKINSQNVINSINKDNIIQIICYGEVGEKLINIISKFKNSIYKKDFSEAIYEAIKYANVNQAVLLSPGFKSFDQFRNFEERGEKFKEIIYKYYA